MKNNFTQKRGITLIALVITIIVLLILAGVSIAMLTGQNGILSQAENAKVQQSHSSVVEAIKLEYNNWQIEINTADVTKVASTETVKIQGENSNLEANETVSTTFLAYLEGKGYVDKDTNKVLVEALLGTKPALGNGETTDIYVLEENTENQTYNLYYLAEDGITRTDLWNVGITVSGNDNDDPFSYTQEDIDKTIELLEYIIVDITGENREAINQELGSDFVEGQKIAVIIGTKEEYYVYAVGTTLPVTKLVVPNSIEGSDAVYISEVNDFEKRLYCVDNLETIIYLNDYGMFENIATFNHGKETKYIKLPNKEKNISIGGLYLNDIYVDNDNLYYTKEGNIIYNKEKTELVRYINNDSTSYTVPDSIKTINDQAFLGANLTNITIPNSVSTMGKYTFKDCKNLTTINLPENIDTISRGMFQRCESLKNLKIPKSVKKIDGKDLDWQPQPFYGCDNLTITVEKGSPLTWEDFENTGISEDRVIFE